MATVRDTEEGYRLLQTADFSYDLDELNDELARRGFAPVSERTFRHYRKLRRYGWDSYLPINQLDVKTLSDPIWNRAARGGRLMYDVAAPIRLRLLVAGELVEIDGSATKVG